MGVFYLKAIALLKIINFIYLRVYLVYQYGTPDAGIFDTMPNLQLYHCIALSV